MDLVVEGLELAPQTCLLDTGASDVRMGSHVAELAGIELATTLDSEIVIGGLRTTGRAARVQLEGVKALAATRGARPFISAIPGRGPSVCSAWPAWIPSWRSSMPTRSGLSFSH